MSEYKEADRTHSVKKVILKITLVSLTNASCISLSWGRIWRNRQRIREDLARRKPSIRIELVQAF